ncbi:hypothetical protein [Enhygromyxa salina]|uniref:hypothetical protein n=1 Tax=Enhygromyxa salina TaxID=215803 RepID=UPI0006988E09|nr:hypothetical protein [Enhygromyxa salina]
MRGSQIDRRKFLVQGGLTVVGAASSGCAASQASSAGPSAGTGGRARELDRLQALLEGTKDFRYHEDYQGLGARTGHASAMVRHHDLQLQEYLRTMLVAGAAHELGPEDPELQKIIRRSAVDIDASVLGSLSQVESMAEGNNDDLLQVLRDEPRLPLQVCDIFEQLSESVGTPAASRKRLRRAANHLSWRLERQDPGLVMAEFATRSNRLLARAAEGPPVLPDDEAGETGPAMGQPGDPTAAPTMPASSPPPAEPGVQQPGSEGALPSYELAGPQLPPEEVFVRAAPIEQFIGQWAYVKIRNLAPEIYFVKASRGEEVLLNSTRARRVVALRRDILSAAPPPWTAEQRARAQRTRRGGGAMLGIGIVLILGGTAAGVFTFGLGSIPVTPGIGLLVTGIVFLARVPKVD